MFLTLVPGGFINKLWSQDYWKYISPDAIEKILQLLGEELIVFYYSFY